MKTIKYMGMALIMAALASCSSDDDFGTNWQNDPTAVRVSATVGGVFTRSNPVATKETDQMNFNGGDAITISTEGQASVNYILKDGTWGPETSGQFLKWSSELMTFTARYPKGSGDFIVPTNQNGIAEIASADYMTATTVYDKIPDDRKVNFAFDRQMARVVITIAGFNNEFSDKASVSEMYVTSKERIAKDGSAVTATSDIIPYSQSRYGKKGSIYYALVAPNTATNYEFIKLRVKYESDVKSLTVKNPVALEAGKSYNFNLTIGKNGVSLGTVSVEDWGNTGTISGGEASIDLIDLSKGNINITSDGYYVITTNGVTTANTITINSNATVQLKNAVISADGIGIDVKSGSPTIIVSGTENSVTSTTATAINVCDGATLTIKGKNGTNDKLTAKGGSISTYNESPSTAGAGIGSSDGGNIVIENVSIDATGGTGNQTVTPYHSGGAGIGSSSSAHCGDITISNAVITATGGKGAPGIGMGAGKSASAPRMGNINIKSSTITATGGLRASAIGFPNEYCFDYSKVTILTGGTINIETVESSETFLNRLTCDLGTSNTIILYKIGKGDILWFNYIGLDGGDWPGVVLKASDQEQTSKDGIGALSK
ncbi:fimbrillin family protein [Prevotella copri]|uniref:fimbrillin family protein n=1 Tax=Segatella copri TaxID=165179 RepID=UPI001C391020|nr:fimbrillin family protein [Segatella copri]MBV3402127.1 fimbrillin family protein [Segatella copri]